MSIVFEILLILAGLISGVFILGLIITFIVEYVGYRLDKANKKTVRLSYKQFKEFFCLSPDSYRTYADDSDEIYVHIGKGHNWDSYWDKKIDYVFSFSSYIDYKRACKLVQDYQENKLNIKETQKNTEITNAFIEEIKKEIAQTDKKANEELLKGAEIVNKVLLDK